MVSQKFIVSRLEDQTYPPPDQDALERVEGDDGRAQLPPPGPLPQANQTCQPRDNQAPAPILHPILPQGADGGASQARPRNLRRRRRFDTSSDEDEPPLRRMQQSIFNLLSSDEDERA